MLLLRLLLIILLLLRRLRLRRLRLLRRLSVCCLTVRVRRCAAACGGVLASAATSIENFWEAEVLSPRYSSDAVPRGDVKMILGLFDEFYGTPGTPPPARSCAFGRRETLRHGWLGPPLSSPPFSNLRWLAPVLPTCT